MSSSIRRVVVSGTYSTGKTTTATALALATGLPLVDALSAREILTTLYPGRKFHHMSAEELLALGLRRLEERLKAETLLFDQGFISDGSVLNEWAYASVRTRIGLNPGAPLLQQAVKGVLSLPSLPFLRKYVRAYEQMAKLHTGETYTDIVHLPVEFDMDPDGHRPVSERYRRLSDRDLVSKFAEIGLTVHQVKGSIEARVTAIIETLELPHVLDVQYAVEQAMNTIAASRESVAKRILDQDVHLSSREHAALIFRF